MLEPFAISGKRKGSKFNNERGIELSTGKSSTSAAPQVTT